MSPLSLITTPRTPLRRLALLYCYILSNMHVCGQQTQRALNFAWGFPEPLLYTRGADAA